MEENYVNTIKQKAYNLRNTQKSEEELYTEDATMEYTTPENIDQDYTETDEEAIYDLPQQIHHQIDDTMEQQSNTAGNKTQINQNTIPTEQTTNTTLREMAAEENMNERNTDFDITTQDDTNRTTPNANRTPIIRSHHSRPTSRQSSSGTQSMHSTTMPTIHNSTNNPHNHSTSSRKIPTNHQQQNMTKL